MSEHTKGRLVAYDLILRGDPDGPTDESQVASAMIPGDARRLAACWNAFENVRTELIELITMQAACDAMEKLPATQSELNAARALIQQQDALLGRKACATKECRELLAARALLREVSVATIGEMQRLMPTIRNYFDACDTLEGAPNAG